MSNNKYLISTGGRLKARAVSNNCKNHLDSSYYLLDEGGKIWL